MKGMEVNDLLDLNKKRQEEEKELDSILSSKEFRNRAMTIEDHHKFMDGNVNDDFYPGAKIVVSNIHLALSVVRRLYKEVGAPTNEDADNAFKHETAHFAEALNQNVNEKDAKIKIYLLRGDKTPKLNAIELRIALPLPNSLTEAERSKSVAMIAMAPEDLSPGDRKLAGF